MSLSFAFWNNGVISYYGLGADNQYSILNSVVSDRFIIDAQIIAISNMDFCNFAVSPDYVRDNLKKNHLLVVMTKGTDLIGFIMANRKADGGVYLDVICAKENGQHLLQFFMQFCEHTVHAPYIELSSIMNVLAFYPRFGFQHRRDCGAGPITGMSPEFAAYLKEKSVKGILKEQEDFYNDPYVLNHIMQLYSRGLSQTRKPKVCSKKKLSAARFRQYKCARDGFVMRKCFGDAARGANVIIPMAPLVLNPAENGAEEKEGNGNSNGNAKANAKTVPEPSLARGTPLQKRKMLILPPEPQARMTRSQTRGRNNKRNIKTKRAPKSLLSIQKKLMVPRATAIHLPSEIKKLVIMPTKKKE